LYPIGRADRFRRPASRRLATASARKPFDSRFATHEDRRVDHVTSEPAIDHPPSSTLLTAALEGRC